MNKESRERVGEYVASLEGKEMNISNRARFNAIYNCVAIRLTGTKPSAIKMYDAHTRQAEIARMDDHPVWMESTIAMIVADELDPEFGWMM